MPLSRTQFNSKNTVLFRAPIQSFSRLRGKSEDVSFLDLDKNGQVNRGWESTGWTTSRDVYEEPALSVPVGVLKDQLDAMGQGEVAIQSDMEGLTLSDVTVDFGTTTFTRTKISKKNTRSVATLIDRFAPLGDSAKKGTAIDVDAGEFLIYTPK